MLNVQELIGFGVGAGGLSPDGAVYVPDSRLYWHGTDGLSGSKQITLPAGTRSVILTAGTATNGYYSRNVVDIKLNGVPATQLVTINRNSEYRCQSSIWAMNVPGGGTYTLEGTSDVGGSYGGSEIYVWALDAAFNVIGYDSVDTDADASDPIDCNVDIYKGGFTVASWFSKGTASCSYLTPGYLGNFNSCTAGKVTTEDVIGQLILMEDGAGGNDGQTGCVCSFKPSRFI